MPSTQPCTALSLALHPPHPHPSLSIGLAKPFPPKLLNARDLSIPRAQLIPQGYRQRRVDMAGIVEMVGMAGGDWRWFCMARCAHPQQLCSCLVPSLPLHHLPLISFYLRVLHLVLPPVFFFVRSFFYSSSSPSSSPSSRHARLLCTTSLPFSSHRIRLGSPALP